MGGVNHVNPQLFANTVINSPTGNANIRFTVRSLSTTIATGFNAGLDAIIYACDYIKNGYLEAILTGGIEEVSYYGLVGLLRSGALSKGAAVRPFASDADGTVAGEGCALFMLETEESARSRGATVIAQIAGTGSTFDPDGFDGDGEACGRAMSMACDMAGIEPARAGFIAASANGNRAGDRTEAAAIRKIFGDTPVAAYKTKTGECYGASPAITLACALADMKNGRITGTGTTYQPVSGINLVSQTRKAAVEYVVVNACSCDGNNSCVVLKNR